jgi:hypothetical protein
VVKPAGIFVLLFGAPHHDALARLARAHQMHRGGAAGVEPVAGKIERRAVAVFQPEHIAVEILGALEIGRFDGVMLQTAKSHGRSPRQS